jgi:hypothetical protein
VPYLLTALLALAVLAIVVGAVSAVRHAGRTRAAAEAARSGLADRSGLLRARAAALRVAVGDRRGPGERVDSRQGETGGRP